MPCAIPSSPSRICRAHAFYLTSGQLGERSLCSLAVSRGRDLARRPVALAHTLVFLADLLGNTARAADSSGIAIVGVDAHKVGGNAVDLDVADHNVAWAAVIGAVTAAAVDLADVNESGVLDGHGSATVVLNDLVAGRGCSATLPEDVAVSES